MSAIAKIRCQHSRRGEVWTAEDGVKRVESKSEGESDFDDLDALLSEIDDQLILVMSPNRDTWYAISDDEIARAEDVNPTYGLDTWDF